MALLTPLINDGGYGQFDPTRAQITKPQQLVYSARIDPDKLSCYYKFCSCYCSNNVIARNFLDVYSNGVHINAPLAMCCCCWTDNSRILFWDNQHLGMTVQAGCCNPCPWCCMHGCGCCGDVVAFTRSCACCPCYGFGHYRVGWFCCFAFLCFTEYFTGLAEGEAMRVVGAIERARRGEFTQQQQQPQQVINVTLNAPPGYAPQQGGYPPQQGYPAQQDGGYPQQQGSPYQPPPQGYGEKQAAPTPGMQ